MNIKKARIGLGLFFNSTTNSGIVNYVFNMVAALHSLPATEQPEVILLHNELAEIDLIKKIGYQNLHCILVKNTPDHFFSRKLNSLLFKITNKNYFLKQHIYNRIDCFYPYFPFINSNLAGAPNKIEWLVDFNNRAFPQFYEDNGDSMLHYQQELTQRSSRIVLSSNTLFNELRHFYPQYRNEVKILRFACSLPSVNDAEEEIIKLKHKITGKYFMSPNQFWEHKNQIVVLKAIGHIKVNYPDLKFSVLFTGSLAVNRGKGLYVEILKTLIEDLDIADYVQFLGVLDRKEQLFLMKHALAIVQPSLYEGWSTLVEEAKAMNKFIILSDILVHKEQIGINCSFFDPANDTRLSEIMIECLKENPQMTKIDYSSNIRQFGEDILKALL